MILDMAKCKGCGAEIVWAESNGSPIPLDPKPPVYRVEEGIRGNTATRTELGTYLVSHFATCREANRFSASKKEHT